MPVATQDDSRRAELLLFPLLNIPVFLFPHHRCDSGCGPFIPGMVMKSPSDTRAIVVDVGKQVEVCVWLRRDTFLINNHKLKPFKREMLLGKIKLRQIMLQHNLKQKLPFIFNLVQ